MDTSVDTRRGIWVTVIKNHILSSVIALLFYVMVCAWLVTRWKYGSLVVGIAATIFYISGIYSYSYEQPKLDKIIKKKLDYIMPLKIGGCASAIILLFSGTHFIINLFDKTLAIYFGIAARAINFPFVFFLHGIDGNSYNVLALVLVALLPIAVSYFAYWASAHGFSLGRVHDNIIYEHKKKEDK